MASEKIKINRAPVLTLWAAVVAERLGYDWEAALTLGRAVAGMNAQSKGQRLGIYEERPEKDAETERQRKPVEGETFTVRLLGRAVPATETGSGVRAISRGEPDNPGSVERYLAGKFGDRLADVRAAMTQLAGAYSPEALAAEGFRLYETFRPAVPEGVRGWGATGELDVEYVRRLADQKGK